MKAGAEAHFLAGQIFTLGIAAVAILPRMPSDESNCTVGGKLSYPFRRALLGLTMIGIIRTIGFHLHHPNSVFLRTLDVALGTLHVVGQSFLCLTTAYILQCQLSNFINIEGGTPGRSLVPALVIVLILAILGAALSEVVHPNFWCLVNLAEAYSCFPVLKTLRLYASVTTLGGRQHGRGPILVQILMVIEYWYLTTSLLSFVGEAADDVHENLDQAEGRPIQILLQAIRHNQDNGVDDWTRLVLHSVFLNSIDELQHFTSSSTSTTSNVNDQSTPNDTEEYNDTDIDFSPNHQSLVLRHRKDRDHGVQAK